MKLLIPFFLILISVTGRTQDYDVFPIQNLNTKADEIIATVMDKDVIFCTTYRQDMVSDYKWTKHYVFRQESARRMGTFASYGPSTPFMNKSPLRDEGPSCYVAEDSILYFSTANNYNESEGSKLKIFSSKWNGFEWSEPVLLPFCEEKHHYAHPYYDPVNRMMVFSSDKTGGQGGMDIWIIYQTSSGWTESVNPGVMINSRGNEIFPTVMNGDIYYASNGNPGIGGYDLFKALRKEQYQASVQLGIPINSPEDDVRILFLNNEKGFITSNRSGGMGGDDIYLFELQPGPADLHQYTAVLEMNGTPLPDIPVIVTNSLGEEVINDSTGANGVMNIQPLLLSRKYKLRLNIPDFSIFNGCYLKILDDKGRLVQTIFMRADGTFDLELLPFDNSLVTIAGNDNSLLNLRFTGQVYKAEPGDVGQDEMISIVDEKGEVVAIAYTKDAGKFQFNNVTPELNYTFRLTGESEINYVQVFDKGEKLVLPVLKEEAIYHRLKADEAIRIINEFNQTLYVSPKDVFVINRIYYTYNSAELSEQAQEQLEQLVAILRHNPKLHVELMSYTDARGTDQYNQVLSEKRADAVIGYLVTHGISKSRLAGKGMGESGLLNNCAENCSEMEHAINRRTEIHLREQ